MTCRATLFARSATLAAIVVFAAGCESSDGPPEATTGSSAGGGDSAALLSADPLDQINYILEQAANPIPGEATEVRYQMRMLPGDSIGIDFEQREAGGDWYTGATAVTALDAFTLEVTLGRRVELVCEEEDCIEYRAPLSALNLARLPEGPGRDRFLEVIGDMVSGEADIDALGGEAELNRTLRESAISFSETVTSWYQVSFAGDWMRMDTWQHAEGFPENTTAAWLLVHLPGLGSADGSESIPCREADCVLEVRQTVLRFAAPTVEDAERLVDLIQGLAGAGS